MSGQHWRPEVANGQEVGKLTILYNGGVIYTGVVDTLRCGEFADGRVELHATEYRAYQGDSA